MLNLLPREDALGGSGGTGSLGRGLAPRLLLLVLDSVRLREVEVRLEVAVSDEPPSLLRLSWPLGALTNFWKKLDGMSTQLDKLQ